MNCRVWQAPPPFVVSTGHCNRHSDLADVRVRLPDLNKPILSPMALISPVAGPGVVEEPCKEIFVVMLVSLLATPVVLDGITLIIGLLCVVSCVMSLVILINSAPNVRMQQM